MRVAFAGTPDIAVPVLRAVAGSGHDLVVVITAPDRPAGRGRRLLRPPVKDEAERLGLPALQAEDINDPASLDELRAHGLDALLVMAYGRKLGRRLLALPRHGCLNVHLSLLPRYRGAAPAAWAIKNGETETGVSVFRMVAAMDAGDIAIQEHAAILPDETTGELNSRLAAIGAGLAVRVLDEIETGTAEFRPQDESMVTFAPSLRKSDGEVNWEQDAAHIHDHVRAMTPWPAARSVLHGRQTKKPVPVVFLRTRVCAGPRAADTEAGTVVRADKDRLVVAAGSGCLEIVELKPAGKRAMSGADFVRGRRVMPGDRFERQM